MPWQQLVMDIGPEDSERLEDCLLGAGAVAVSLEDAGDQPLFEPPPGATPLWDRLRLTALLARDADPVRVLLELAACCHPSPLPPHRIVPLADEVWERAWLKDFKPMHFGRRLWVVPTAHTPPDPTAVNLRLDPGLAFGTGTHPTTALCLQWLDGIDLAGKTVVDFGCGSGILAIAALKLGAARVIGIDIDPQAIQASRDNAERNGVAEQLELFLPEDQPKALQADILVANILAGPLRELAPLMNELVRPGGLLALSGVLETQAVELEQIYGQWFDMEPTAVREEWCRLSGVKR